MALTTTTLAAAVAASDTKITVAAATGFAAGDNIQVDNEFMTVTNSYVPASVSVPVLRGVNGTFNDTHASGANVTVGLPSDFSNPSASVSVAYPLSARRRKVTSYSASGAITLPTAGEDLVVILNGTSTLGMTIANPTKDIDGAIVYIIGNGKSASTVDFDDTVGLQGAGSSYDTITFQNNNQGSLAIIACNGAWLMLTPPVSGTTTNLTIAIS